MSYGELMWLRGKLNSGGEVPLNHLLWLDAYKTFGKESYVYQDKNIWQELCCSPIVANDKATQIEFFQNVIDNDLMNIGIFFGYIYGMEGCDWKRFTTMDEIAKDMEAMEKIVNNASAMTVIANSKKAMATIAESVDWMRLIEASRVAVDMLAESSLATETQGLYVGREWLALLDLRCYIISVRQTNNVPAGVLKMRQTITDNLTIDVGALAYLYNKKVRVDRFFNPVSGITTEWSAQLYVRYITL